MVDSILFNPGVHEKCIFWRIPFHSAKVSLKRFALLSTIPLRNCDGGYGHFTKFENQIDKKFPTDVLLVLTSTTIIRIYLLIWYVQCFRDVATWLYQVSIGPIYIVNRMAKRFEINGANYFQTRANTVNFFISPKIWLRWCNFPKIDIKVLHSAPQPILAPGK